MEVFLEIVYHVNTLEALGGRLLIFGGIGQFLVGRTEVLNLSQRTQHLSDCGNIQARRLLGFGIGEYHHYNLVVRFVVVAVEIKDLLNVDTAHHGQ